LACENGKLTMNDRAPEILRPPAEERWADELHALSSNDAGDKPPGWHVSPRSACTFITGSDGRALAHEWSGKKTKTVVSRKFYGDDALVERAVIGLASNRALLLVGEPGTAKSLLSELLAAAISGTSVNVVQGTAATTDDQIRYSWNYAMLLAEGPTQRALVPSPLYVAMKQGILARFEEITRCPPEVQDSMVSILSEKLMTVPELDGDERLVFARPGFNVIATANIRDRGVHEMSSALKRRFNFETVHPIADLDAEVELVRTEATKLLETSGVHVEMSRDVVEVLVTAFQDLRTGTTAEGIAVERPTTVMSTAEAVAVAMSAGLDAFYYGNKRLGPTEIARHLGGAVLKDSAEDLTRLKQYWNVVVTRRGSEKGGLWADLAKAKKALR
jgi:MoxR-like ATPase